MGRCQLRRTSAPAAAGPPRYSNRYAFERALWLTAGRPNQKRLQRRRPADTILPLLRSTAGCRFRPACQCSRTGRGHSISAEVTHQIRRSSRRCTRQLSMNDACIRRALRLSGPNCSRNVPIIVCGPVRQGPALPAHALDRVAALAPPFEHAGPFPAGAPSYSSVCFTVQPPGFRSASGCN
jgi:hypothetical protein